MGTQDDITLGEEAVRNGLITREQLERARELQALEGGTRPLGAVLVAQRMITARQLAELLRQQTARDRSENRSFGKFTLLRKLGEGGSGEVWLAEDTQLKRRVALKFLAAGAPSARARFAREAIMAAALDHPNIVKIFEVGDAEGQAWIAMQYVEGANLGEIPLDLKDALRAVRDVAEALAYAHAMGIIHRDIKPDNIRIDRNGRVFLGDFGLAREIPDAMERKFAAITRAGTIHGTPSYMSPEQARGEPVDARSDVYSLGATLYHLAVGRPPFEGTSTIRILEQVVQHDPPRPRAIRPDLPKDVETVILKAMDKDAARRYQTAREMAQDLDRILRGEPVQARRRTLFSRVWRKIRKHRASAALAALLVLALAAGLYFAGRGVRSDSARLVAEAQVAYLLGRTGEAEEKCALARRLDPGNRAAKFWSARVKLQRYAINARLPQPLVLNGLLEFQPPPAPTEELAKLRGEALAELKESGDGAARGILLLYEGAFQEAAETLRAARTERPDDMELTLYLARALYYLRQFDEAAREALAVLRTPWAGQALEVRALALHGIGLTKELHGQSPEEDFREAAAVLKGQPHPARTRALVALAAWLLSRGRAEEGFAVLQEAGDDPEALLVLALARAERGQGNEAEELFRRALKSNAHPALAGQIYRMRAEVRANRGKAQEAIADLQQAYEHFTRAGTGWPVVQLLALETRLMQDLRQAASPEAVAESYRRRFEEYDTLMRRFPELRPHALYLRGRARTGFAVWKLDRGMDPSKEFSGAIEDLTEALSARPAFAEAWLQRAMAHNDRAVYLELRGQDPTPDLERAMADYAEALRIRPEWSEAYLRRGNARLNRWYALAQHGRGSEKELGAALEDLQRSLQINPENTGAWISQGKVLGNLGVFHNGRGMDPRPFYEEALDCYARAEKLNPEEEEVYLERGKIWNNLGAWQLSHGEDASKAFRNAAEDLTRAITLQPDLADAWVWLGNAHLHLAAAEKDPGDLYREALRCFEQAVRLDPNSADAYTGRGDAHRFIGAADGDRAHLEQAMRDYQRALQLRPGRPDTIANLALAWTELGDHAWKTKEDPTPYFAEAARIYTQALALRPNDAELLRRRGQAYCKMDLWRIGRGLERRGDLERAEKDLEAALAINPNDAHALRARGYARAYLGRPQEALADLEQAVKLNPALEPELREAIRQLQKFRREF